MNIMHHRLRAWVALIAVILAAILVLQRVRVFFVVQLGWVQLLGLMLVVALAIYLLLHFVLDRLGL